MNSINLKTIEVLKEMKVDGGKTLYDQLLEIFESEYPKHLSALTEAVETMNYEKINFVAHTLKSSCQSLGLEKAAGICQEMERQAALKLTFDFSVRLDLLMIEVENGLSFLKGK